MFDAFLKDRASQFPCTLRPMGRDEEQIPSTPRVTTLQKIRKAIAVIGFIVAIVGIFMRARVFGKGLGTWVLSANNCRSGEILTRQGGGRLDVGGICTKDCTADDDCGAGFRCVAGNHCAPVGTKKLGETCDAPWDCQSQVCVATVSQLEVLVPADMRGALARARPEPVCSQSCSDSAPCPTGFTCTPDENGEQSICVDSSPPLNPSDFLQ